MDNELWKKLFRGNTLNEKKNVFHDCDKIKVLDLKHLKHRGKSGEIVSWDTGDFYTVRIGKKELKQ